MQVPTVEVISNVDLSIYKSVEQIRSLLQQQLYSPVRWVETVQLMQKAGIEVVIECGPGKVLSGLIKRIDKSLKLESAVTAHH
jgi:[acyl-carrier-protein] S-malonyltransferase